jgi:hypothetical protein
MSYTLQAIITQSGALSGRLPNNLKLVPLMAGVDLVPLGQDARQAHDLPFLPLTDEGQTGIPAVIVDVCQRLSASCKLAYVEAEVFGGTGTQAHALFSAGQVIGQALVSDVAINEALRHVGVQKGRTGDEFDTAGLGRHRDTDDWLD